MGEGQFVAVGEEGTILTSLDTETWTPQTALINTKLNDIIWTNNQFVVSGEDGTILTSPNGETWTFRGLLTSENLRELAYDGSTFVVTVDRSLYVYISPSASSGGPVESGFSVPTISSPGLVLISLVLSFPLVYWRGRATRGRG